MEENFFNIPDELIENLSVDQIAELKVEVDDLLIKLDNILETCNESLES